MTHKNRYDINLCQYCSSFYPLKSYCTKLQRKVKKITYCSYFFNGSDICLSCKYLIEDPIINQYRCKVIRADISPGYYCFQFEEFFEPNVAVKNTPENLHLEKDKGWSLIISDTSDLTNGDYTTSEPKKEKHMIEKMLDETNYKITEIEDKIEQILIDRKAYLKKTLKTDLIIKYRSRLLHNIDYFSYGDSHNRLTNGFIEYFIETNYINLHKVYNQLFLKRKLRTALKNLIFIITTTDYMLIKDDCDVYLEDYNAEAWKNLTPLIDALGNSFESYLIRDARTRLEDKYSALDKLQYLKPFEERPIVCEKCGSSNPVKAIYCCNCGYKIVWL